MLTPQEQLCLSLSAPKIHTVQLRTMANGKGGKAMMGCTVVTDHNGLDKMYNQVCDF